MKMRRFVLFAVLVCLLSGYPASRLMGQERSGEPAWLLAERADAAANAGEYGQAIQLYRRVLAESPGYVAAHEGLGRAFEATADLSLAVDHYRTAVQLAAERGERAHVAAIQLRIAGILKTQQLFKQYQDTLLAVAADDPAVVEAEFPDIRDRLSSVYADEGLDRLLVLYRLPQTYATPAHSELAVFLVHSGRYDSAMVEALLSVTALATTVVEELILRDPLYEFEGLGHALQESADYDPLAAFIAASSLYRDLYYLAAGAYGQPSVASARALSVWQLLAGQPSAGIWGRRATAQLRSPTLEPVIYSDLQ